MVKRVILGLIVVLCVGLLVFADFFEPESAWASSPPVEITLEGRLTDSQGLPFDGDVDVVVSIYDALLGGDLKYSEEHQDVVISNGYYSIPVGAGASSDSLEDVLRENGELWMTMNINSDGDMEPRIAIRATPYAINALALEGSRYHKAQGAPALSGKQGDLYFDTSSSEIYVNSDGDLQWDVLGAGGSPGSGGGDHLVREFPVGLGEIIDAGDVVSFINGAVWKGYDKFTLLGDEEAFDETFSGEFSAAVLGVNTFVVVYAGSGSVGMARIGEVSGTTISYGPEFVFESSAIASPHVVGLHSSGFVVSYQDYNAGLTGVSRFCSVSGNQVISAGAKSTFGPNITSEIVSTRLSSNSFVVAYQDMNLSNSGYAVYGSVVGSSITFGAGALFGAAQTLYIDIDALNSSSFLIAYSDFSNSGRGEVVSGEVSSDGNIAFGQAEIFSNANSEDITLSILPSSNLFFVAYRDAGDLNKGKATVGEVFGPSVTLGSSQPFSIHPAYDIDSSALDRHRCILSYRDSFNSHRGLHFFVKISPNHSLSYGPSQVFHGGNSQSPVSVALSPDRFVVAYRNNSNSEGAAIVGERSIQTVGVAQSSGSSGESIPVVFSGVSSAHQGLTSGITYYASSDGDLSSMKTPVRIGLAVSPTEIMLKSSPHTLLGEDQFFGDMIFANEFRITEALNPTQGLIFKNSFHEEILWIDQGGNFKASGELNAQALRVGVDKLVVDSSGALGLGLKNPLYPLHLASGAHMSAEGEWFFPADKRIMKSVESLDLQSAIQVLEKLKPLSYSQRSDGQKNRLGFLAQDLLPLLPQAVSGSETEGYAVNERAIIAVLTKVVQNLCDRIEELEQNGESSQR